MMRLSRFTKVLLILQLLLAIGICCTPSKGQLQSITGLWGPYILLNRVRDFGLIPLSFGTAVCLVGSVCTRFWKLEFLAKLWKALYVVCAVMAALGIYWTVGTVCMIQLPLMPNRIWLYFLKHSNILSLWWIAAAILFLCAYWKKTPESVSQA